MEDKIQQMVKEYKEFVKTSKDKEKTCVQEINKMEEKCDAMRKLRKEEEKLAEVTNKEVDLIKNSLAQSEVFNIELDKFLGKIQAKAGNA